MDDLAGLLYSVLECETNPRQICGYCPGMEIAGTRRTRCSKVNYSALSVEVREDSEH